MLQRLFLDGHADRLRRGSMDQGGSCRDRQNDDSGETVQWGSGMFGGAVYLLGAALSEGHADVEDA
jgi:hypothetical protein